MVYRARSTNENGEGDGRVVPVSNEDRDRSSDLRKDANNPTVTIISCFYENW